MNANARMNALNNANIGTENMFSLTLKSGATLNINVQDAADKAIEQIKQDGYVSNDKLYRRWICAQMLRIVDNMERTGRNFSQYVRKEYSYGYQYTMMENEVKALIRMEYERDKWFDIRSSFFSLNVIARIYKDLWIDIEDYVTELTKANEFRTYHHRPYITVGSEYVELSDADRRFKSMKIIVERMATVAQYGNYKGMLDLMAEFRKELPRRLNLRKSDRWIEAFKGEGAYYTLENLILFHGAEIETLVSSHDYYNGKRNEILSSTEAFEYMNEKVREGVGGYWLFGMLKVVLSRNNISIHNLY